MPKNGHNIIVIGTSAGGMQALEIVMGQLPADLPASVFIVQHLNAQSSVEFLAGRLDRHSALTCKVARHGATFKPGYVYFAPPDLHLLLKKDQMLVVKGPRENQFRPSIDPLFRSAAAFHGSRVVGVMLTGLMSDGAAGMDAIRRSGGVLVVQDPAEAEYPDLPRNIIRQIGADHIVTLAEMGSLFEELAHSPADLSASVPPDILQEAQIAERIMTNAAMTNIDELNKLGKQVPYSCPECGGSLWELSKGRLHRFRCHSGHAYTDESLVQSMGHSLEETLWVALRMLEERRSILQMVSEQDKSRGKSSWASSQEERAEEMKVHIDRIREILLPRNNLYIQRDNGEDLEEQQKR
jgi:two-component system, chemotaxis family, protein-glutamate methylesterase/glutaminase